MSAYAPQSGETEKIKEKFLKDWEDVMSRVPKTEKIVVGADLNGHVGRNHEEPRRGTSEHFLQQKRRASNHL